MEWEYIEKKRTYLTSIYSKSESELTQSLVDILRRFADEVVARNRDAGIDWDFLFIRVKAVDGHVFIWPQLSGQVKKVFGISIYIEQLMEFYKNIEEDEIVTKGDEFDRKFCKTFVSAAESIHLDKLVGKETLPILFYSYYEEDEEPFYESIIGKSE